MDYIERRREKYRTDPEFRKKAKEATAKWRKKKLSTDPVYKEQYNEYMRNYQRERYHNDPEYREKILKSAKKRYWKRKKMND